VTPAFAASRIIVVHARDAGPLRLFSRRSLCTLALATACLAGTSAYAFEIETGNADLKASWDTTVKYGAMWRIESRSPLLVDLPPKTVNQDDGDRNFARGLVSNRVDLFTEADVTFRNFGARVSAAGWYDAVYERSNDNNSPATANQHTVPFDEFTHATRQIHGNDFRVLDAFVFGKGAVGDAQGSFRAGRHALLWGESLFFGANGIAGTQAPVDVVKLLSVPNSQFKETILPVGQVSGQIQFSSEFTVAAYYQLQWTQTRLPAVGSFFSNTDLLDFGGERLLTGPPLVPQGMPAAFYRDVDQWASDHGQGGAAVHLRALDTDFGLYAIRWHSKSPQVYIKPAVFTPPGGTPIIVDPANFNPATGQIGRYFLTFPEDILTYGASASRSIGDVNLAGEVSVRHNLPLVSDAQVILPGVNADNHKHPLYAVGNSVNAQASFLWTVAPSFLAQEATALGEVAWNRRTSITKNPGALDPNTTQNAASVRVVYEPLYRQVWAGLDISVPMGGSYTHGRSSTVQGFGVDKGGDLNIGVTAAYLDRWRFALYCTHYYGPAGTSVDSSSHFTFEQSLADRDFVAFTVRTTF
jgi:Protein of unknown function (DUF1302)